MFSQGQRQLEPHMRHKKAQQGKNGDRLGEGDVSASSVRRRKGDGGKGQGGTQPGARILVIVRLRPILLEASDHQYPPVRSLLVRPLHSLELVRLRRVLLEASHPPVRTLLVRPLHSPPVLARQHTMSKELGIHVAARSPPASCCRRPCRINASRPTVATPSPRQVARHTRSACCETPRSSSLQVSTSSIVPVSLRDLRTHASGV